MRERFESDFGLTLQEAETLTSSKALANYFEEVVKKTKQPKKSASWILNEVFGRRVIAEKGKDQNLLDENEGETYIIKNLDDIPFCQEYLVEIINMVENEGIISRKLGKDILGGI